MKAALTIVKIGGHVIDDAATLQQVLQNFTTIEGRKLLVHGGGKKASQMSESMGITPQLIEGRRITDASTLEIVTMVYGGLINKNITAQLQSLSVDAIGLSGADANLIPAQKRVSTIDYGFVGDFKTENINTNRLQLFLDNGLVPVLCALTHDQNGQLLNTNADTISSGLACALSKHYDVTLFYCLEKNGVLMDVNDDNSVLKELSHGHYETLKLDGTINTGMIPKLDNGFAAVQAGVQVVVKHALNLDNQTGTLLT